MTGAHLTVDERRDADSVVLVLSGEIDIATVPALRLAAQKALAERPDRVLLDFGGVSFCDSQGLSALIGLNREVAAAGSALVLVNVGPFVARLLEITGLGAAFTVESANP